MKNKAIKKIATNWNHSQLSAIYRYYTWSYHEKKGPVCVNGLKFGELLSQETQQTYYIKSGKKILLKMLHFSAWKEKKNSKRNKNDMGKRADYFSILRLESRNKFVIRVSV